MAVPHVAHEMGLHEQLSLYYTITLNLKFTCSLVSETQAAHAIQYNTMESLHSQTDRQAVSLI